MGTEVKANTDIKVRTCSVEVIYGDCQLKNQITCSKLKFVRSASYSYSYLRLQSPQSQVTCHMNSFR